MKQDKNKLEALKLLKEEMNKIRGGAKETFDKRKAGKNKSK